MKRLLLVALLIAAPVAAQMPAPGEPEAVAPRGHGMGNPMFAGMSEAGRLTMRSAMHGEERQAEHAAVAAARDRMLAALDAERLDVGAVRRAMDDERDAANAAKVRHQAALLTAFQQLSVADRRAFVANTRAMRSRVEARAGWAGHGGRGQGMAPPPQ